MRKFRKIILICPILLLLFFSSYGSNMHAHEGAAVCAKKHIGPAITHGQSGSLENCDLPAPTTILSALTGDHSGHKNDPYAGSSTSLIDLHACPGANISSFARQLQQYYTPTQRLLLFPKHWFW